MFHYRISYRILEDQIRVVRMRHTSQSPHGYWSSWDDCHAYCYARV